jgi:hypothetical protein
LNPIFAAALEVQDLCRGRTWPFCFIGGLAVTGFGHEEEFVDALLGLLASRKIRELAFAFRCGTSARSE